MAYVDIWLRTRNWSHFLCGAALTHASMLVSALGSDLIRIARVLSSPAMTACQTLLRIPNIGYRFGRPTICWPFFLTRGL